MAAGRRAEEARLAAEVEIPEIMSGCGALGLNGLFWLDLTRVRRQLKAHIFPPCLEWS